jgi:hypothetical protein
MKNGTMMIVGMELKFKLLLREIGQLIVYVDHNLPMLTFRCTL